MDNVESRASKVGTSVGEIRLEERPQDIAQAKTSTETNDMPREEARPSFEKEATSGALNLPYGSDNDEEEFIYVPNELLEGRDI